MTGKNLRAFLGICALALMARLPAGASGAIVFTDAFNRSNSSTIGNNWVESNPGGGNVAISSNMVDLMSDNGGDTGSSYITQAMSNFSNPWNFILTNNSNPLSWTFNMRANNADLSGFDAAQEAIAFVLAANGSNLDTANGYAVVIGQSGSTDPVRLVSFTGGLDANANVTNIISATGAAGTPGDPGTNYLSIKVAYDPFSDTWELFARNDGTSAFTDAATGTLTSYGTAVNTTYTGISMSHIGLLGHYDGNNDSRLFDNVVVDPAGVPEPASLGMFGVAGLALLGRRRTI